MDRLGLQILISEIQQDAGILRQSSQNASLRIQESHPGHLEACGYELHRFYNVLEKTLERLCQAFENHFEKKGDYHERLLDRLQIEIPGVRPAFIPPAYKNILRELKGFRHVFRHAYDLELRQDRLLELTRHAQVISDVFPQWLKIFEADIKSKLTS
jgi:hypothetical protein